MPKLPFLQRANELEQEIMGRVIKTQKTLSDLEGEKAVLNAEVSTAAESLSEIQTRTNELASSVHDVEGTVQEVHSMVEVALYAALEDVRRGRKIVDTVQQVAVDMSERLTIARTELDELQKTKEGVLAEIRSEQAAITRRRAEMDAFEAFIIETYSNEIFPLSAFGL